MMPDNTETILLTIGNETIKALKADQLTQNSVPKGTWQVSYTVEKSSLTFNIFLDYDKLIQQFAGMLADPPFWITLVALFSSTPLNEYVHTLPKDVRFVYVVNGDQGARDWEASCTIEELLGAAEEASGKSLDEALPKIMSMMDLDRR
jgi:hypothetical protein